MSVLAAVRPDSWNLALFVHVLGAMILVGGLFTGAATFLFARGDAALLRLGTLTLLAVSLPGWLVMRVGAEWIYSKEGWDDLPEGVDEPGWLTLGAIIGDAGGLVLLAALGVGGLGLRRQRATGDTGLLRVSLGLSVVLLAAYLVAVWAMAGRPN